MIAGALAQLRAPVGEPLETYAREGGLPALEVVNTQTSFDDRPIQHGTAATRATVKRPSAHVTTNANGEPLGITVEKVEETEHLVTDWVADVTGSGLIAAASADGDGDLDFPFDLFWSRTGQRPKRLDVDVATLHEEWSREDALGDVWMSADDAGGASIEYHARADERQTPTIGLGFERPWRGTVMKGVVYESGYCAIFSTDRATEFCRFVEEQLLPYAHPRDQAAEQTTLGGDGGGA